MLTLGAHISISKGFTHASQTALNMGANTFQFFSRNPRGSGIKELDPKDIERFLVIREENSLGPLLAHAPYTLNLASAKGEVYGFSKEIIKQDIRRMDSIGIEYFNFHPGSPGTMDFDLGLNQIIDGLSNAITGDENITVLLETMSGRGSEIGGRFEHLKMIIDGLDSHIAARIGVCLDTCHVFSAGYDIVNNLDDVLSEFDDILGMHRLKAIHLNDSMTGLGSAKDRHAPVGEGEIGMDAILRFMTHPITKALPYYLETPFDDEGHKKEIAMIREMLSKV